MNWPLAYLNVMSDKKAYLDGVDGNTIEKRMDDGKRPDVRQHVHDDAVELVDMPAPTLQAARVKLTHDAHNNTIGLAAGALSKLPKDDPNNEPSVAYCNTVAYEFDIKTPRYPDHNQFDSAHAQNVGSTWCEVFYLISHHFPPGKTIYTFHIEDNDCEIISAVNHYLRATRLVQSLKSDIETSIIWSFIASYSDGNLNYIRSGYGSDGVSYTRRPNDKLWMKGPDGKGIMTPANIRGFSNQIKMKYPSLSMIISSSGRTYMDIMAAISLLTKNGTAIIRIGSNPTYSDIAFIIIAAPLFETASIIMCGRPYIVLERLKAPLGIKCINKFLERRHALTRAVIGHYGVESAVLMTGIHDVISNGGRFDPSLHIQVAEIDERLLLR